MDLSMLPGLVLVFLVQAVLVKWLFGVYIWELWNTVMTLPADQFNRLLVLILILGIFIWLVK